MEQRSITGQAFRVLTDAANGIFHRISLWTHADDVEMRSGDNLTTAMENKYNVDTSNILEIMSFNDIEDNTAGVFTINEDVGTMLVDNSYFWAWHEYTYFCYNDARTNYKTILVVDHDWTYERPFVVLRKDRDGWHARNMSSERNLSETQARIEQQIAYLESIKFGYDNVRRGWQNLDDIKMNTCGSWIWTQSKTIGYHDEASNTTTYIMPGEYVYFAYQNTHKHKTIILFSNTIQDGSGLTLGGGYICTNAGTSASKWVITRILSPTDFSTDETGLREQIVTSLTCQLWPVGSIYLNLTRQNPGEFLGGTWNLITEGILTAIKGSPEQAGYHQRDLYKAVKDEDRGQHLYGVFAWQRIA